MKRYEVCYDVQAHITLTVEAESDVDAADKTDEMLALMGSYELLNSLVLGDTELDFIAEV